MQYGYHFQWEYFIMRYGMNGGFGLYVFQHFY